MCEKFLCDFIFIQWFLVSSPDLYVKINFPPVVTFLKGPIKKAHLRFSTLLGFTLFIRCNIKIVLIKLFFFQLIGDGCL